MIDFLADWLIDLLIDCLINFVLLLNYSDRLYWIFHY